MIHCVQLHYNNFMYNHQNKAVCLLLSYGSHLIKVKDYYENDEIGNFVNSTGTIEYWTGQWVSF